jgi:hypothetical protein
MSVGNHQICSLLIVLIHFINTRVSYEWCRFSVICSEEWKGVGRNTDYVKIMKISELILSRQFILTTEATANSYLPNHPFLKTRRSRVLNSMET